MPLYEYDCPVCGRIEVIQKFSDDPLTTCPLCKKNGVESPISKVVSLSSFNLKGSGWYATDYHGKNSCNSGEHPCNEDHAKDATSEVASEKASESASTKETKPAPKKESAKTTTTASAGK